MATLMRLSPSKYIKHIFLSMLAVFMLAGNITTDTNSGVSGFDMFNNVQAQEQTTDHAAVQHSTTSIKAPAKAEPMWVVKVFREHQALAIFITLGLGYWLGAIKFGHFSLGAVTGTLIAGVIIGQLDISISSQVKSMFFTMFLFAVGYGVGPQFVRGIAKNGAPQAIFAVVISFLCFAVTYAGAKIAGYDVGLAAGLWAGAQTISASIGLATDAINSSGFSNTKELLDQIPVAYAICYLFGTIGTGMILAYVGPTLLGVNLEEACKDYEKEMSAGTPEDGISRVWHRSESRTYEISDDINGMTVAEFESQHHAERLFIEKLKRNGEVVDVEPTMALAAKDIIALTGHTDALVHAQQYLTEVADEELDNLPLETVDLVVTNKKFANRTLVSLADEDYARGVFLNKISRGAASQEVPLLAQTEIHRGDVLSITGTKTHTSRMEKEVGHVDRTTTETDMVWVGLFIVVFGLLGALAVNIDGAPVTLSVSGGVLIGGLVLGWLRSIHPTFARLPEPTQWFMNSVGLNVFIAIVGISAGPGFVAGLENVGPELFLIGAAATAIPMLLAPLIGKYIFKFHPAINLGVCGGARTSTASVAMVGEKAKSNIPMLGYTVPYAVSNTLLTLMGMFMVLFY
ncbi:aspartate-alanine antiporter [Vibrio mediterranei]|uniref:Aspartate-alanine antiporter n=1 Tax=Vibrio mediterranei TaxID=689 RepID=A0ABX5D7V8_9VIBR|nr:aspartate-alanine antiporter [Vibrio mediterranei]PCD85350.1 aspartate-alanine antiporter [Vibrio mediterranei]PRQ65042.1 aspartate-alanine antiporter [Vibrio mediterranei]